ncbi:hypothetical protein PGB90_005818 [Kerria lacca]
MLALEASMERERCALRDRQVRLHSVHTDLELDLPPSIHLPDGEEIPYGSSSRLRIRDIEQESEIYRECIRAPPNKTIEQSDTILPYRSSSTGLLSLSSSTTSSSNSSSDWGNVVRCHSMSSSRYNAAIPPVILPTPVSRNHHRQVSAGLSRITMVPCLTDHRSSTSSSSSATTEKNPSIEKPLPTFRT